MCQKHPRCWRKVSYFIIFPFWGQSLWKFFVSIFPRILPVDFPTILEDKEKTVLSAGQYRKENLNSQLIRIPKPQLNLRQNIKLATSFFSPDEILSKRTSFVHGAVSHLHGAKGRLDSDLRQPRILIGYLRHSLLLYRLVLVRNMALLK